MPLIPFIISLGGEVTVREKKSRDELGGRAADIENAGARLVCGEDYLCGLSEDIIIRSPGIRPDIPEFAEAKGEVTCEMELFAEYAPCPVFAVTGSDGKSTTTTILSKLLMPEGKAYLGGNIGEPLFHRVNKMEECDGAAVELSSFQLMNMDAAFAASVITNVTPNHLNWHTGMDEYIEAKKNILKNTGRAVLNFDNEVTREIGRELLAEGKIPVTWFSLVGVPESDAASAERVFYLENGVVYYSEKGCRTELMHASDIVLPGLHNVANYMAAAACAWGHTTQERIRRVASTFGGVKHRLQLIAEKNGVRFYNSSIDSSPTRTAAAISALRDSTPDRKTVIICGGYDKNIPFEPLAETLLKSENIKSVVLTGATRDKIMAAIDCASEGARKLDVRVEADFDSAVRLAADLAENGDSVLLSPACASFDAFPNFEVRGERFAELVRELP